MSKTQEALKKAIEALELINEHAFRCGIAQDAIKMCKEALVEQKEPVLYIDQSGLDGHATWAQPNACQDTDIPLYTSPPKRELADKEMAKLICDIETYVKISGDQATEIVELQAQINELREVGQAVVKRWDSPNWSDGTHTRDYIYALKNAMSKTPAQSLQEHDNEVIEECAKLFEIKNTEFPQSYMEQSAKAIRALKGKQNES